MRHDFREGSDLTHASLAIKADIAPWLEGEHFTYLSQHGNVTGGGQLIGSWALSPRLTLEPRLTLGWSAQDIPTEELASGVTDVEISARLLHSFGENVDIYVGVIHERLLGGTHEIALAAGETSKVTRAVIGAGFNF